MLLALGGIGGWGLRGTLSSPVTGIDALAQEASANYAVYAPVVELGNRVTTNRQLLITGVPVAGAQMLLLCWLTLGLALRHAGAGWRADAGLLKLRGATQGRVLVLAVGRSAEDGDGNPEPDNDPDQPEPEADEADSNDIEPVPALLI